jgi:acyl transferase domain-containing protein
VPNPAAQRDLIAAALQKAGVDARAISYIEAHGTGTEQGDPIEIEGLAQAFRQHTQERQFCAIGSAKTNIGHLESAAGIAGLTKVLLQMRHGKLVPSLHAQQLNPLIDFTRTPFKVQQEEEEWLRPVVERREQPRLAGISSFGAGGANAHVIVEEYREPAPRAMTLEPEPELERPALVVLSAKSAERLTEQAKRLLAHVTEQGVEDGELLDVAYTLQVGREAMSHRLGFTAATSAELQRKLTAYLAGALERGDIEECYCGEVKKNKDALGTLAADAEFAETVDKWLQRGKYARLLDLWVKGLAFDWQRLYENGSYTATRPKRVSLPTYPFAPQRYWIDAIVPTPAPSQPAPAQRLERAAELSVVLDAVLADELDIAEAVWKTQELLGESRSLNESAATTVREQCP